MMNEQNTNQPIRCQRSLFHSSLIVIVAFHISVFAESPSKEFPDGTVIKNVVKDVPSGFNLLSDSGWRPWQKGFERQGKEWICDNGDDSNVQRGVSQTVTLNQKTPEPIVAAAWSRAENIGGSRDSDYSLYLDLVYSDDTPLWGQIDSFRVGTHDWQQARVVVFPEKPVKTVSFHMLLRRHTGKAWFRDPSLSIIQSENGAALFDGIPVSVVSFDRQGFQIRDVAANSDFVAIRQQALGVALSAREQTVGDATFFDLTLEDTTHRDRAITFLYTVQVPSDDCLWLADPRRSEKVQKSREYITAGHFRAGVNGRLSRYPFAAVSWNDKGYALGIDMAYPAFYRVGYHTDTQELFLAYDLGFTPEQPRAKLRLCRFNFNPRWEFRGALQKYYELFPEAFECRIPEQGLWMPFARISDVKGWQDFGFRFKEGTDETAWDDQNNILTFRYTEPLTWWMSMPSNMPRTIEAAISEARRLADTGNTAAKALLSSGYHDDQGRFAARLLDTPWCNGAVWSMNSMPDIVGDVTDFKNKWNPQIRQSLYGPQRKADQDGEYIDSSEGYVTDELDFRRDHFSAATTPLTFSPDEFRPAIFRGLIAFEYVRRIARDVHADGKRMMANATPDRLCWLAPSLDVLGTETDWNPGKTWRPMSDSDLLYRRAVCGKKPYCFLMNTVFEEFSHDKVEKYMKRCLAYGMFPGFFSHNASEGHYFKRPELYERDRDLFKKYVPLCKQVAEAGWEPITRARSNDPSVYVERFGTRFLTVFNDSPQKKTVTIRLDEPKSGTAREHVCQGRVRWENGSASLILEPEDVAVIEID